jgi:hypothetical protein
MEVGAYPFANIDFSVPVVPEMTAQRSASASAITRGNFFGATESDSAVAVSAGVAATLVLATLF